MRRASVLGLLLAASLAGCDDGGGGGRGGADGGTVSVVLDLAAPRRAGFDIDGVVVAFTLAGSGEVVTRELAVSGDSASGLVELRPGRWDVRVELFDGTALAGAGEGSVVVVRGFVTRVDLLVDLATGGVSIHVDWSDEFHGTVADLSRRPVRVEVSGVGVFQAHGLSRVGWDIEVIETPTQQGRTHKDSGLVSYPDVAVLGLAGTEADALALAGWIAGPPDPRTVRILVQGLGGELAVLAIVGAVAVDGEPGVVPEGGAFSVGGVVLGGIRRVQVEDHDFLTVEYPRCPAPGQRVEIEGVSIAPCYPEEVLEVPAPGTSDPITLPAVRDGETLYDWASSYRDDVEQAGCVGCGNAQRRNLSVIDLDPDANELGRVNLFDAWVSGISLFDPDEPYGYGYLFHLEVVTDRVERG